MAQRRMFSKKITETDAFLDMSMSAQCLYFHLNMSADDDGFIGNAKTIRRMVGASEDDFKILMAKEFLIPFESGVVVIKDWKIHNYIRSDRYNETVYQEEKSQLKQLDNGKYEVGMTSGIPNGYQRDTQVRLGKDRLGQDRREIESASPSHNTEVFDVLSERKVDMSKSQPCYKISQLIHDIDDIKYLHKAIDIAESKGVLKAPYILSIIENWIDDGKDTYTKLVKHEKQNVQHFKKQYGTPNHLSPEQEAQINKLGF